MGSPAGAGAGGGTRPTATIIVPTYRRPEGLSRALGALARLESAGVSWDVVVIDNDAAPGAEEAFRDGAGRLDVPARYVREPSLGAAHARNRGIAEASGDITVMLDDDVSPHPGWLRALLSPIIDGRADATGGRVELDPAVLRPRWFDERWLGPYLGSWDLGPEERPLEPERPGEFLITSNCAFDTALLRACGGFDPKLGPRASTPLVNDDAGLTRAFAGAGGRMRWVPGALVTHDLPAGRVTRRYLLKRAYAQGRSDWILDSERYGARKFGGARIALHWLGVEAGRRAKEGLGRREVLFHAGLDVVRTAGSFREAARIWRKRP